MPENNIEEIGKIKLDLTHYPGEDYYCDGDAEDELLEITRNYSAVEYQRIIEERKSWEILYHLSSQRENIVEWLPITKEMKVLEVGSGCGAITGTLAGKAGEVTCIDLSRKRSRINAYRHMDADNVTIHVGNFQDVEPDLPCDYDYICLIGVFEYAQAYIRSETPYEDFLKIMLRHVKEGGRLVIAIENRLGLKYFAGCKEDHLGTYFSGLEGYPDGGSARTFTRSGLERIFKKCGVENYSFYYPYPDYKFPIAIYSDKRLPDSGELTDNIRNFDRDRMVLFNEKYVFDGITKDHLFDVFSNSYLVVIGEDTNIDYVKYSNDRAVDFALRTEILDTPKGRVVHKVPLSGEAKEHIKSMKKSYELLKKRYEGSSLLINPCEISADGSYAEFPFEKGITLEVLLDECLDENDMEGFYKLFDRYLELISYGEECQVTDYDLIFANILVDGDTWTVIDYEWTVEKQIPTSEIAFRALYCYVLEEEKRNKLNLDLLISKMGITQQEAEDYREKESRFQKQVTGKRRSMGEIRASLGTYCVDPKELMEHHLQKILDQRIQVYYDRGNGFSEEDSFYLPDVYTEKYLIEADIFVDGNVKTLRIDPADRACMVKILEISMNGKAVPLQKKYIETNGKAVKAGSYIFDTADPNISIKVTELPMAGENTLSLKMKLIPMPEDMAQDMMGAVKRFF